MSGLANRLVTAARDAFRKNVAPRPGGPANPLIPALAAALRELDAEVGRRILSDGEPIDLAVLAEVIEKGEQT